MLTGLAGSIEHADALFGAQPYPPVFKLLELVDVWAAHGLLLLLL